MAILGAKGFDFKKLTESELKQFKNLKKMLVFGNGKDAAKLRKICDPLGIEVEPLAIGFNSGGQ